MTDQQPKALQLAAGNELRSLARPKGSSLYTFYMEAAAELRRLHAENEQLRQENAVVNFALHDYKKLSGYIKEEQDENDRLEAKIAELELQLESIGAGGVGPIMLAAAPQPPSRQSEPTDSMGIPLSCGKPLCASGQHHPLCVLASASQPQGEQEPLLDDRQLHIGACITEGRLYANVMRIEPNESVTVIAMASMDASYLTNRDCIARMLPAQQPRHKPLTDEQIKTLWGRFAPIVGGTLDFARAVERAHGIGRAAAPQQPQAYNHAANEQFRTALQTQKIEQLNAERDKLLAALEALADYVDERTGDNKCRPLENARAVIAQVGGAA